MNVAYWDGIAPVYQNEVHDSLAGDRNGVVVRALDAIASPRQTVGDFGCGIGGYSRALASRFCTVISLDHSARLLDQARATHLHLNNVTFRQADLAAPLPRWSPVDAGICMNVLIMPSLEMRQAMLRTMHRALKPGAPLLVVLPSLESALYTDTRLVEWNMRDGMTHRAALRSGFNAEPGFLGHPAGGIVDRGGEPTKHYLKEEALVFLRRARFTVRAVEKVEYQWDSEFESPPRWLHEPYPWDWLLSCRRA